MPYEKDFCATCNRLRVSSVGKLHLCLFGDGGVSLRDLLQDDAQQYALEERISDALREKKADPLSSPEQYWYYAKFILHWRLILNKEISDESGQR